MHPSTENNTPGHAPSHQIHVTVFAPRAVEPKPFIWEKTMKIADAAKQAALAFGYQTGNPGLQTVAEPPVVLDNNKPLVAEHVKDGDQLELVDTGGGV